MTTIITSLPYTITTAGTYKLGTSFDMASLGNGASAITINSNDVTLDFDGYALIHSGGPTTYGFGVYGNNRSRVKVLNGKFIGVGMLFGIRFDNTDGFTSEGKIEIRDCSFYDCGYFAIRVAANDSIIQGNRIRGVTGNTVQAGPLYMKGIEIQGARTVIKDNVVQNVYGIGANNESVLISIAGYSPNAIVSNNIMSNDTKVDRSMGLWTSQDEDGIIMVGNFIKNTERALFGTSLNGFAEGNITLNVGGTGHDMFDIPSVNGWTGNNMGT